MTPQEIVDYTEKMIKDVFKHHVFESDVVGEAIVKPVADFLGAHPCDVGVKVLGVRGDRIDATFTLPTHYFLGWSAGELRAIGVEPGAGIPDCAIIKLDDVGVPRYQWVTLDFVIDKEGNVEARKAVEGVMAVKIHTEIPKECCDCLFCYDDPDNGSTCVFYQTCVGGCIGTKPDSCKVSCITVEEEEGTNADK